MVSNDNKNSESFDCFERSDLNYPVDLCRIAGNAMIGLFVFGGAEIAGLLALYEAYTTPGRMSAFYFGLCVMVPYNLFFLGLAVLHFTPDWWKHGTNEKRCDPNWQPVQYPFKDE